MQLRVLHELVYSARRMGNAAIAIRLAAVFCIVSSLQSTVYFVDESLCVLSTRFTA